MKIVPLGNTGLLSSVLGLGCSRIGSTLNPASRDDMLRLIHTACDLGITLFDTADIYGQGESERLLGQALASRGDVVIATKAGQQFSALGRIATLCKQPLRLLARHLPRLRAAIARRRSSVMTYCAEPSYLRLGVEASLKRLNRDHIDIFYLHNPPVEVIRDGTAFGMLADLRRAGKLRAYGVSCDTPAIAAAALEVPGVSIIQIPIHPDAHAEFARIAVQAQAQGIAVIARNVLGGPRQPTATAQHRSCIRTALHQSLARSGVTAALIGTTNLDHLRENVAALAPAASDDMNASPSLPHRLTAPQPAR